MLEKKLYNYGFGHTQTIADLCFETAEGDYIYDTDGVRYVDLNGTLNLPLGHNWENAKKVLELGLPLNAVSYATRDRLALCQELEQLFPGYGSFQFYSAGTEANEGAIRYAIAITGRDGFASFRKSYHGRTRATVSLCNMKSYNGNRLPGYYRVDYPTTPEEADLVLKELETMIQMDYSRTTAGVFLEPVQGKTVVIPPAGFLHRLRKEICDRFGLMLIADEYLTSMRTGVYSVCLSEDVTPDIFTIGKCLGNGIPFAVLLCKKEYSKQVGNVKGSTTFGGNPFACRVSLENLRQIQSKGLIERTVQVVENIFREETTVLANCSIVTECRAKGALLGIAFTDKTTCIAVAERCLRAGVLASCIGTVLRITPSFTIDAEVLRQALRIICRQIHLQAELQ